MLKWFRKIISVQQQDQDFTEVFRGGAIAFLYRLCSMILGYVILVVITREFGEDGLGLYNLALAVLSVLLMLSSLGFNASIKRFAAQYNNPENSSKLAILYRSVLKLILPLSLTLALILYITAPLIANQIYNDPSITIPLRIVAFTLPVFTFMMFNVEFINGLKLVHISEFFRSLNQQLITLLILLFFLGAGLLKYYPIIFYASAISFALIFTTIYLLRVLRRINSKSKVRLVASQLDFRSHLLISIPMIFSTFIQMLNGRIDTLMIGIFEDTGTIGIYSAAFKITMIINFVLTSLKTIATPKISELFWAKKIHELKSLIYKVSVLIFIFSLPVCILLVMFAEPILVFIDADFDQGTVPLIILAFSQLINSFCGLVAVFLNMTGDQVYFTKLIAISTLVNVILNYVLIPEYGMTGAAIATFVSIAIWNIAGAYRIFRKHSIYTFFNPFARQN